KLVPTGGLRLHGMRAVEHELDAMGGRRPQSEGHAVRMQLRAETHAVAHAFPENTSNDCGGACIFARAGNSSPTRAFGAVSRSSVQREYSGRAGSMNSMARVAALSTM